MDFIGQIVFVGGSHWKKVGRYIKNYDGDRLYRCVKVGSGFYRITSFVEGT